MRIETYSEKLELKAVEGQGGGRARRWKGKAVEGQLVGYSNNSKGYRVYNPDARRILESRNVIFIETPSRLFPPPSEETSHRVIPPSNGRDDHN